MSRASRLAHRPTPRTHEFATDFAWREERGQASTPSGWLLPRMSRTESPGTAAEHGYEHSARRCCLFTDAGAPGPPMVRRQAAGPRPYQQRSDRRRRCSQTAPFVAKRPSAPALLLVVQGARAGLDRRRARSRLNAERRGVHMTPLTWHFIGRFCTHALGREVCIPVPLFQLA